MKQFAKKASSHAAFTLVELMVVIAIIVILAGLVVGGMRIALYKANEAKTRALMTQLEIALEQHKQEFGYFPQTSASPLPINRFFIQGDPCQLPNGKYVRASAPSSEVDFNGSETGTRTCGLESRNLTNSYLPGKYFLDITTLRFVNPSTPVNHTNDYLVNAFGDEVSPSSTNNEDNRIYYQCPGVMNPEGYDLWTAGADGIFGDPKSQSVTPSSPSDAQKSDAATVNSDDFTNWKRN